jgi:hypothetical protein
MNFLAQYQDNSDDEDNNDDDNNNADNDNRDDDSGDRSKRVEKATHKRAKLNADTSVADLPEDFFAATPNVNVDEEKAVPAAVLSAASKSPAQAPVAVVVPRQLLPPQLARRRANQSTEDDVPKYK